MKNRYKSLVGLALTAPLLMTTGCIEETFPNNAVTQEQLGNSSKATEALVWGMASNMNTYFTLGSINNRHFDFGNPALIHARDVMTEDMSVLYGGGYDWFSSWSALTVSMDPLYTVPPFMWNFYYTQVLACNNCIGAVDKNTTDANMLNYLGTGYAFRAATYLDLARTFEFLPNANTTPTNGVTGLTVPIVTEETTEEQARNNPRAPHNEMVAFIKSDLEKAIECFRGSGAARMGKTLPDLAVAYGLMARLYLWDASYCDPDYNTASDIHAGDSQGKSADLYKEAARYADLAISTSKATPLTRQEWANTVSGFNDPGVSSWMWAQQYVAEDGAIKSGIINWASFVINEQTFGYTSAGAWVMIGTSLYDQISDRDFRKLSWIAPEGAPLSGQEPVLNADFAAENLEAYYSIKFRPGSGNMDDPKVGAAVGIPLMRVEEMYMIQAEALEHVSPGQGLAKLQDFMKTYRYGSYRPVKSDNIEEIILQKRIELWGEGHTFFDVKRLNMSVTRAYDGSNFEYGRNTYNTQGRPYWMNLVIPDQETRNNEQILGKNNPSIVDVMTPVPNQ